MCPLVYLASVMYMSPLINSSSILPSLVMIFGFEFPPLRSMRVLFLLNTTLLGGSPGIGSSVRNGSKELVMLAKSHSFIEKSPPVVTILEPELSNSTDMMDLVCPPSFTEWVKGI